VVAGSPVDWLQYTAAGDSQRAVRLSGRWFSDRPASAGAAEARLTLTISYRDAAGAAWTAGRAGNHFVIVRLRRAFKYLEDAAVVPRQGPPGDLSSNSSPACGS
jgi:hypothetical protein